MGATRSGASELSMWVVVEMSVLPADPQGVLLVLRDKLELVRSWPGFAC